MFKPGDLVRLVDRQDDMPPIGSIGEVLERDSNLYEVQIVGYPCPVPPGTTWVCAAHELRLIPPLSEPETTEREVEHAA